MLVVAAHADDETIGAGGTLFRYAEAGVSTSVLILTHPAVPRYPEIESRDIGTRRMEAELACQRLGVTHLRWGSFPEIHLTVTPFPRVVAVIEKTLLDLAPDVVYTHRGGDLNQDHRVVAEAVQVACRPGRRGAPRRLLGFSVDEWMLEGHPRLTSFSDISGEPLERKLQALQAYTSEVRLFPHSRALETVRARAEYLGGWIGVHAAEGFEVLWEVT